MNQEAIIRDKTIQYLLSLGYNNNQISQNVTIDNTLQLDFVIYKKEIPWIAIEAKGRLDFTDKKETLKFNPYIRQLQSYAIAINAPYYLLTDGNNYYWFTTDTSGRPQLLENPILPGLDNDNFAGSPTKEMIISLFREIKHLQREGSMADQNLEAAIIILAKLLSEHGDTQLRDELMHYNLNQFNSSIMQILNIPTSKILGRRYLEEVFWILDRIRLSDASSIDILSALDEVFLKTIKNGEPRVSRWVADLLVEFSELRNGARILDLNCEYGDIISAAKLHQHEFNSLTVLGFCRNSESAVWAKVQQLVLKQFEDTIKIVNPLSYDSIYYSNDIQPSNIITIPPFGNRGYTNYYEPSILPIDVKEISGLYLQLAVNSIQYGGRVVMLVPENLLFTGGSCKALRDYLINSTNLVAIISLSAGAIPLYPGVKTSIIVFDKKLGEFSREIFMAHIEKPQNKDYFYCNQISDVAKIISNFKKWSAGMVLVSDPSYWVVQSNKLNIDNFTANYYLPFEKIRKEEIYSPYPMYSIKKVAEIVERGKMIKLVEDGDIYILGPGAIRPMEIDLANTGRTVESNLPLRSIITELNDVVINNIGTYLGAAAVIDENSSNTHISQHVLLIKPDPRYVLPEYLALALNSKYVKPQIARMATGVVMSTLSVSRLKEISIPLPDLEVQYQIVQSINRKHNELYELRNQLNNVEKDFTTSVENLFVPEV